jgi:hypothetical protein
MDRHNAAFTRLRREVWKLGEPRVLVGQTNETKADVLLCGVEGVSDRTADRHAETLTSSVRNICVDPTAYLWESSNLLVAIAVEVLLCVVDSHAAVNTVRKSGILHDRDTLV